MVNKTFKSQFRDRCSMHHFIDHFKNDGELTCA
jgi:hypothetical protein